MSFLGLIASGILAPQDSDDRAGVPALSVETAHPWRPPFGLDRVGAGLQLVATAEARPAAGPTQLVYLDGERELDREVLLWPEKPPFRVVRPVPVRCDRARMLVPGEPTRTVERAIARPEIEAEAVASASPAVNPVDLGALLVPTGWLLLGPGQRGVVEVAALSQHDREGAVVRAWFGSEPSAAAASRLPLSRGTVGRVRLGLPEPTVGGNRETLHVVLEDGRGGELWRKSIPVMIVRHPPKWPRFGATTTRLRYDAPISVRDPATGSFSSIDYEKGWPPSLSDLVVSLPDGGRYVFWRGSSYIPFWATEHNTGACYEWAEMLSRPADAVDCVEPLMDKELRYGRVEIVESTPACVRVRWTYQSTDLRYQVWGDAAVEEYTFYPDGFGVRALSLKTSPGARYELSEFIILTPQGTYPLSVLPETLVEAIGNDGTKLAFRFPFHNGGADDPRKALKLPAVYRFRPHRDATRTAVYFTPQETRPPPTVFAAFQDRGEIVTPCYWGSHWPLARGNATGSTIDERVALTPCHNSVMSWVDAAPIPLLTAEHPGLDALGRSRTMQLRRWAWLIALSDAPDARLLQWARSFATPPALEVRGAALDQESYAPERRALRLRAQDRAIAIGVTPRPVCVNPVFELEDAPAGVPVVALDGNRLEPSRFAWDGRRLWVEATLEKPARLDVEFHASGANP